MKTTIDIKDELFFRAKEVALQRRITFRALIEEALTNAVSKTDDPLPLRGKPVKLDDQNGNAIDSRDWEVNL